MGRVVFVGAGPGAPDLLTLRGAQAIGDANVVIWASSLVDPRVLEHARPGAEIVDSAQLPMERLLPYYQRAAEQNLDVARVHSGDPVAVGRHPGAARPVRGARPGHRIVPGVSSFTAVAAAIDRELTIPEVAQSVILTRLGGGKTPMPPGEQVGSSPGTAPRWRCSCPPPGPASCRTSWNKAAIQELPRASWRTR